MIYNHRNLFKKYVIINIRNTLTIYFYCYPSLKYLNILKNHRDILET